MKYVAAAVALMLSGSAFAADMAGKKAPPPPPEPPKPLIALPEFNFDILKSGFDYAFGAKAMSDYISRGITQTAHRPAGTAYGELRYGWFYGGIQAWSVNLPTDPAAELDVYGGIRPVWGPLTADFGVIGYLYPGNRNRFFLAGALPVAPFYNVGATASIPTTATDPSYVEVYGKLTYALNDYLSLGTVIAYDPNWNNYGARAYYYEGNAKVTIPDTGFSVSGAFARYEIGYARGSQYGFSLIDNKQSLAAPFFNKGFKFASYYTWNIGATYNYKAITFDLRYSGTNLGRVACAITTSDPAANLGFGVGGIGRSDWCSSRVMATVGVEFSTSTFDTPTMPAAVVAKY